MWINQRMDFLCNGYCSYLRANIRVNELNSWMYIFCVGDHWTDHWTDCWTVDKLVLTVRWMGLWSDQIGLFTVLLYELLRVC